MSPLSAKVKFNPVSIPALLYSFIRSFQNQSLQVCYVDYGNVEWIIERNIRCIREEYMSLPFQAVHCRLAEVIINDEFKSRSKETK